MQEVVGRFQICAILKRHNSIQHAERLFCAIWKHQIIVCFRHNGIHHVQQRVSHIGSSLLPRGVMVLLYGNRYRCPRPRGDALLSTITATHESHNSANV